MWNVSDGDSGTKSKGGNLVKKLENATSLVEAVEAVANGLTTKLCRLSHQRTCTSGI